MNPISRWEFLAGALAGGSAGEAAAGGQPPNVLLIMMDQHRADAMGASGNRVIRTPNLYSFARSGFLFTECWA